MKNIYFYGGAFNPLTLAHQQIIDNLVDELHLGNWNDPENDILVIAITSHDYKNYEFNKELRNKFVKSYMDLKYLDKFGWEITYQDKRTWEFLHNLFVKDVQKDITLIIGQDEYDDLKDGKWHHSDEILNTYKLKVIPRTDDISSTKVRELIKTKQLAELNKYIGKTTEELLKTHGYL